MRSLTMDSADDTHDAFAADDYQGHLLPRCYPTFCGAMIPWRIHPAKRWTVAHPVQRTPDEATLHDREEFCHGRLDLLLDAAHLVPHLICVKLSLRDVSLEERDILMSI